MGRFFAIFSILVVLSGCAKANDKMANILSFREELLSAEQCTFQTNITADYGKQLYHFSVDCSSDKEGNVLFSVSSPETIAGITGRINGHGGQLIFDDAVLAFPFLAEGLLSPISAPWVFMNALRSGYIVSCGNQEDGIRLTLNDTYAENALRVDVSMNENCMPYFAEIYWKNARVLSFAIENFRYM